MSSLSKPQIRSIMMALAFSEVSDEKALDFIYNLATSQMYKSQSAFLQFCTNCAIYYTSATPVLMRYGKIMNDQELRQWENGFISKIDTIIHDQLRKKHGTG